MATKILHNLCWYTDNTTAVKGNLGIRHSYMASLATAINFLTPPLDPVWLMGSSSFAFRIFINEVMCPSAMSVFDWDSLLPEAVEQTGYQCTYISRLWHEENIEEQRRNKAHFEIISAIDQGIPAIVWDIADAEWGLIIGYDADKQRYHTLTWRGDVSVLPYDKLGRNGIDIMSVVIIGEPNVRSRDEIIARSLHAVVSHAEQKEWMDRPKYQDGLPAYVLWADLLKRWALLIEAGREGNIQTNLWNHASYYAEHWYSSRCYARDYLKSLGKYNQSLILAAKAYEDVALSLELVWSNFSEKKPLESEALREIAKSIGNARFAEEKGIKRIKDYLKILYA